MMVLSYCLCLFLFLAIPSMAAEFPDYQEYLTDDVRQALTPEWLSAFGLEDGEFGVLFGKIADIFQIQLQAAVQAGIVLLGMLIVITISTQYAQSITKPYATNTVQMASMLCFGLTGYTTLVRIWESAGTTLHTMKAIIATMTPSVTALMLAGGNSGSAGVYGVGAAWFVAGVEAVLTSLLYPAMHLCYGMVLISGMSADTPLGELAKWVRKMLVTVLVTGMGALALVFGVQGVITQSADSVTAKTMKFALGNTIPFVGSAVGESVRTIAASLTYLRSAVGVAVLAALVALLLPTVLNICFYKCVFSFVGQMSNVVDCKAEAKLLCGISDILNIALAILISCFVCSVVLFALFAKSTVAFA